MRERLSRLFFTLSCGLLLVFFWTLAWGFFPAAGAGPWYVDPDGSDGDNCLSAVSACQTIQAAVNRSSAGDTIFLAAGVYTENLVLAHALVISGAGPEDSIIDGSASGQVIQSTADLQLDNLGVQNGAAAANGAGVGTSGSLVLSNVYILENVSTDNSGGGVYAAGGLVLLNSKLSENECLGAACDGGGAYTPSTLVVTGTRFISNTAGDEGGGFLSEGFTSLWGASVLSNTASKGGGGAFINSSAVVSGSLFQANSCTAAFCFGGGLRVTTSLNPVQLAITASQLLNNQALLGAGAGAAVNGNAAISRTLFISNTSVDFGGGLLVEYDLSVQASQFSGNACLESGCHGAALDLIGNGGESQVLNSIFFNNQAPSDGAVLVLYDTNFGGPTDGTAVLANNTLASDSLVDTTLLLVDDGSAVITNSIFTSATLSIDASPGAAASQDYNLFFNAPVDASVTSGDHWLTGLDPLLASPSSGDLRLLPGSPAIDYGQPGLAVDIRGYPRPQLDGVDLGVYEVRFALTLTAGADQETEIGQPFPSGLELSIASPDGDPVTGGQIGFFAPLTGASLTFAPAYTHTLTGTSATLPVTANLLTGPFLVQASTRGVPSALTYPLTNTRSTPGVHFSAADPEPAVYGQPFWITATITSTIPITPSGVVTFTDPSANLELTATLDLDGQAVFTPTWLAAGAHTFGLAYSGDGSFFPGSPDTYPHQVDQAATGVVITPNLFQAVFGQPLFISYTQQVLSPGAGSPGGSLQLYLDQSPLDQLPLAFNQVLTTPLPTLPPGAYQLWAAYSGDDNFSASLTPSTSITISQAAVSLGLLSSPNPSVYTQMVTFTADLQVQAPGAGIPTGVISFTQDGQVVHTAPLDASGVVSYTTTDLPASAYIFQALYSGDVNFLAQASDALTQTVEPAWTTTSLTTSESIAVFGQPLTFTAQVQAVAPGGGVPTGTIEIADSQGLLVSGTLDAQGMFTYSPADLEPGTYVFTATYLGVQNYQPGVPASLVQVVNRAPVSLLLDAYSPDQWMVGALETITFSVVPDPPGAGTPTGVVTAALNLGPAGCSAALVSASGSCSLMPVYSALETLRLTYPGDVHFLSQEQSFPFTVNARYYVNHAAHGLHTGLNWTDAFTNVEQATTALSVYSTLGDEIWVAQGVYRPALLFTSQTAGRGEGSRAQADPRTATFRLPPLAALIGGFAGTETSLDQRDWRSHPTYLDGDLGLTGVISDNAYHVLTGGNGSILDGFTIRHGNADDGSDCPGACGGGMLNIGYEETLRNLIFQDNRAAEDGGAIYNLFANVAGENLILRANQAAANGGAMNNRQSWVSFTNLAASGNLASRGGAVFNERSRFSLVNATLAGNQAAWSGGADYSTLFSSPVYTNTILAGNTGPGVEVYYDGSGQAAAANSIFVSPALPDGFADRGGNLAGVSPLLASLPAVYPSASADLRLLPGSPAIDAGTPDGAPTVDLRGLSRPQLSQVDIGAYETPGFTVSLVSGSGQAAGRGRPFKRPLVVQVASVLAGEPVIGGQVLFTAPLVGPTLSFAPTATATLQTNLHASLAVTAGWVSGGPYTVTATVPGPGLPANFSLLNGPSLFLVHLTVQH